MPQSRTAVAVIACAASVTACSGGADEPPIDRAAVHADSVMLADSMYDPAAFDTIIWDSAGADIARGAVVFSYSCAKCHGEAGLGDGGFVQGGDTLRPPSFVVPDWRFAEDRDGLRRQVFTGTAQGMPHWGFYGLKYRDIDAVAAYIQEELR